MPVIASIPGARGSRRRSGAAALIVVLVLFFIVSLVAAYTSRNMIFEQRTSTNQYRSTQAVELGEAGIEWAITKLNAGLMNDACIVGPAGTSTFRARYIDVASADGVITPIAGRAATCTVSPVSGLWTCECPAGAPTVVADGPNPGFRVHFVPDRGGARPNLIRIKVSACTQVSEGCLSNPQVPSAGRANAIVSASVALKGAIDTIPAAAITIPLINPAVDSLKLLLGATVAAYNTVPSGSGVAIQAGGTLPLVGVTTVGAPGSPAESARVESDASISSAAGGGIRASSDCPAEPAGCPLNRMFAAVFGAPRSVFLDQPALVRCLGGCNSGALGALAAKNPRSVIYVPPAAGGVTVNGPIGTAADPVALVVEGQVRFQAGGILSGAIYSTSGDWTVDGTSVINGAIVSETEVQLSGPGLLDVRYDPVMLAKLRREAGSFVRVPGGWRDWQPVGTP